MIIRERHNNFRALMHAMMNLKAYSNQDARFEVPGDAPRLEPSLEPSVDHMDGVLRRPRRCSSPASP
ncbi:hypothetical protein PAHAL_9G297900 [Panicum hallii]|uniref:Uncharacterized protein n=1 Tax=Panicum hallii TaxID=206008 RepID=A0A2S3IMG1_9POAL|nr:hypothetical protein PAHAL_9G297900 [Panicum hallii]